MASRQSTEGHHLPNYRAISRKRCSAASARLSLPASRAKSRAFSKSRPAALRLFDLMRVSLSPGCSKLRHRLISIGSLDILRHPHLSTKGGPLEAAFGESSHIAKLPHELPQIDSEGSRTKLEKPIQTPILKPLMEVLHSDSKHKIRQRQQG